LNQFWYYGRLIEIFRTTGPHRCSSAGCGTPSTTCDARTPPLLPRPEWPRAPRVTRLSRT